MKRLVLDASSTLAGFLPDENSLIARDLFSGLDKWDVHVPALWPLEVSNALLNACRRGRLADDDAHR
ncbi:type II toxin-antitoxin system VapC family toxin, partial [Klebsiella michiganensis]|uniref:type II toxin-antitoxin system VapC family toxin n=1 Tax=Klebsiella michiganensis TaxID=1134687 RepID=UPI0025A11ED1